jgi:DNA-binding NarL/FixJ family response regulator
MRTLLSPFEDPTLDDWRLRVNREIREFVGAAKAVFLLPTVGAAPLVSEEISTGVLDDYLQHYGALDEGLQRQQRMGWDVWSVLMCMEPDRHRKTEIFNDWKAPNALWGATGISVAVDSLPASVVLYDPREDEVQEERQMELLRLVRPAYEAGIRASVRVATQYARLTASVDRLSAAVAFVDGSGRLVYLNRALKEVLAAESDRKAIEVAMAELGRRIGRQRRTRSKLWDPHEPESVMKRVSAAAGEYTLSAAFSGVDDPHGEELVLVSVDPPASRVPSLGELQRGHRLTRREAEIAHAIALGQTTPQIAHSLGISIHTARRHSEHLFVKFGVHSRVELTARILTHRSPPS